MRDVIGYWAGEFRTVREGVRLALDNLRPTAVLGAIADRRRTADEAGPSAPCVLCGRSTPPDREAFRVADLVVCRDCQEGAGPTS